MQLFWIPCSSIRSNSLKPLYIQNLARKYSKNVNALSIDAELETFLKIEESCYENLTTCWGFVGKHKNPILSRSLKILCFVIIITIRIFTFTFLINNSNWSLIAPARGIAKRACLTVLFSVLPSRSQNHLMSGALEGLNLKFHLMFRDTNC